MFVKGDNVGALTLLLRLKASGRGPKLIARELSMEYTESMFEPALVKHISGKSNEVADILSRRFMPGVGFVLPEFLANARETKLPSRGWNFYRTARGPDCWTM